MPEAAVTTESLYMYHTLFHVYGENWNQKLLKHPLKTESAPKDAHKWGSRAGNRHIQRNLQT